MMFCIWRKVVMVSILFMFLGFRFSLVVYINFSICFRFVEDRIVVRDLF